MNELTREFARWFVENQNGGNYYELRGNTSDTSITILIDYGYSNQTVEHTIAKVEEHINDFIAHHPDDIISYTTESGSFVLTTYTELREYSMGEEVKFEDKMWTIIDIRGSLYTIESGHTTTCIEEFKLDWYNKKEE